MPRGGARVGSGRKPHEGALAALHGHRARRLIEDGAAAPADAPIEPVDPPPELPAEARTVWAALAPHALRERTLTPATAAAFALLCSAVALERRLSRGKDEGSSNHRGMMQRVEAGLSRFRLAPTGKPAPAPAPVDPFAEFTRPQ